MLSGEGGVDILAARDAANTPQEIVVVKESAATLAARYILTGMRRRGELTADAFKRLFEAVVDTAVALAVHGFLSSASESRRVSPWP